MGSGGALTVQVFSYKVHNLNDHANRIVFAVVANTEILLVNLGLKKKKKNCMQ